jgi:hypothetical protein
MVNLGFYEDEDDLIKVVDPLNVADGYFECKFNDYTDPGNVYSGCDKSHPTDMTFVRQLQQPLLMIIY